MRLRSKLMYLDVVEALGISRPCLMFWETMKTRPTRLIAFWEAYYAE